MGFLLASTVVEFISLGIILLTCVYYYYKNAFNFWKKKGIKFVKPVIPFGSIKNMIFLKKTFAEVFKDFYDEFPEEPYVGIYELTTPSLLLRDPELIKHVLVKDFSYFQVIILL